MKSKTEKDKGKNILTFGAGTYMCQEQNDEKYANIRRGLRRRNAW